MAGTIVPWFRQQFLDSDGDPLALGSLETYEAGTVTPLATYSNAALSVSNGTTITLNAGGYPEVTGSEVAIFLLPRAYKFILKNAAGVTQRTVDNVFALQAASATNIEVDGVAGEDLSAGNWAYLSDGSGALTAGRWYKADADLVYGSIIPIIGFVPTAIGTGATGAIRVGGIADNLGGLVAGTTYFLSGTAGSITATPPTNARPVGVASSATVIEIDTHWAMTQQQRKVSINAASPYALTWPAADAAGALMSNGAGVLSFGKAIVQIVTATYSTQAASSSSTFADTGLTATITPTSAANKVLVIVFQAGCAKDTGDTYLQLTLNRGGSDIVTIEAIAGFTFTTASNHIGACGLVYLDSPATTGATIYKTRFASGANIAQVLVQGTSATSSIALIEVTP